MLCLLFSSFAVIAHAEEAASTTEFKGEGGLGLTINDGNSETQNLNASLAIQYIAGKFTNNFDLFANQAESTDNDGITTETADSLKFSYKLDYNFDEKNYIWAGYINDSNVYAGYDPQTSLSAGYGRSWIKNDTTLFNSEIGIGTKDTDGVRFDNTTNRFIDNPLTSGDESLTQIAANFEHKFNENTQFIQKLLFQLGEDNDYTESFSAIKVAMSDKLSLQFSYLLKKNSDIVGSRGDDTDSTTAVTAVYGF